jgi:hypothetical protein
MGELIAKRQAERHGFVRVALCAAGIVLVGNHCGGSTASPNPDAGQGHDAASEATLNDGAACEGTAHGAPPGMPVEHRATAASCARTKMNGSDAASPPPCTTDADCQGDAGNPLWNCVEHGCGWDACLADADCLASQVCVCESQIPSGKGKPGNSCVSASCHVDSDCAGGGYCAPSRGACGNVLEYDCTSAADTCVTPQTDCSSCSGFACVYDPMVAHFVCSTSACHG